ncbi:hypothetical protein BJX63DRAFT_394942 [Aspergillus granulosus]|uniref:Uncharacterized protein n=1 Tax=Aspergillus granulosus TaxID=176169 RepID=A0ABR4HCB6_9EURO
MQSGALASSPPSTRSSDNTRSTENTSLSINTRSARSSKLQVTVEPRSTSEQVQFPPALEILLEEWHEQKGREIPPCRYNFRKKGRRSVATEAYDRDGKEVRMTEFSVLTPIAYGVLVAQYPDNSIRLVASLFPGTRKYGSYYRAWLGIKQGFEKEASVVRHFGNLNTPDVTYRPEAWLALRELLESNQPKKDQPVSTVPSVKPSHLSGTRKRTATQGSITAAGAKRRQTGQRDDTSSGSEETDSSDEDEETDEDESDEGEEVEKNVMGDQTLPTTASKPELRFRLAFFRFRVQNVREFPADECKTGKELFEKARDFFSIFDDTIQVKVLSCQISSRPDQHYIFAGSEGEFNLLLQQAQDIASGLGKPLAIEVGLVKP